MTFVPVKRGTRRIISADPRESGPGYLWRLDCGHALERDYRPRCQLRAVCEECRRATPAAPEAGPNRVSGAAKRLYRWRKAKGICVYCTDPAKPERTMCQRHLDNEKAKEQLYRRKRVATRDGET